MNSFEKCSLCGESTIDMTANVLFSGEEIPCHDLDGKIFVEEGVASGSSRCEMSQSFYAETCCIKTVQSPCNLCSSNGIHYLMKSNMKVEYESKEVTCLDVYHTLFSRHEDSSEHCLDTQDELFDQCCEEFNGQPAYPKDNMSSDTSPNMSPTESAKPTPEELRFDTWYAGGLKSSASKNVIYIGWSVISSIVMGMMVLY